MKAERLIAGALIITSGTLLYVAVRYLMRQPGPEKNNLPTRHVGDESRAAEYVEVEDRAAEQTKRTNFEIFRDFLRKNITISPDSIITTEQIWDAWAKKNHADPSRNVIVGIKRRIASNYFRKIFNIEEDSQVKTIYGRRQRIWQGYRIRDAALRLSSPTAQDPIVMFDAFLRDSVQKDPSGIVIMQVLWERWAELQGADPEEKQIEGISRNHVHLRLRRIFEIEGTAETTNTAEHGRQSFHRGYRIRDIDEDTVAKLSESSEEVTQIIQVSQDEKASDELMNFDDFIKTFVIADPESTITTSQIWDGWAEYNGESPRNKRISGIHRYRVFEHFKKCHNLENNTSVRTSVDGKYQHTWSGYRVIDPKSKQSRPSYTFPTDQSSRQTPSGRS